MIYENVFSIEFSSRTMAMLNVQMNLAYNGFYTYNKVCSYSIRVTTHVDSINELWKALQIIISCNQRYKLKEIIRHGSEYNSKFYVINLYF